MVEVNILKKINEKKFISLINFLYSLSSEICFTSFHNYHIDEEVAVEALNEYKQRCKEKHRELQEMYDRKEPFLLKILSKFKVKTDDEFVEYKDHIFQNDMALCNKMDQMLEELNKESKTKDYSVIFPEIKDELKEIEVHMYDSVSVSLMPLDLVICNASDSILKILLKMNNLTSPVLLNKQENTFLINPIFCNAEEAFAVIHSERGFVTMVLKESEYKKFKTLKIRHKKEFVNDEKKEY